MEPSDGPSHVPVTRKIGLSCAECRRSKLKCDRVFPCQSCIRRGCSGICPEGTLAATKGNQVLMAHAQRLTEQVKALTERVHDLETALEHSTEANNGNTLSRSSNSDCSHRAQRGDCMDAQSVRSRSDNASELLHNAFVVGEGEERHLLQQLDLPQEIMGLVNAFPFGSKEALHTDVVFINHIPPKERAEELAQVYYRDIAWLHNPVVQHEFDEHILGHVYGSSGLVELRRVHPHQLSIFFTILANGASFESYATAVPVTMRYYAMARAAFALRNPLHEVSCVTVQALFMIVRLMYTMGTAGYEERWILAGICARLSQVLGLQCDNGPSSLSSSEVQRRRRLYWELLTWELWTSLVHGRPPALLPQYATCPIPEEHIIYNTDPNAGEAWWHSWKYKYIANCLFPSITHLYGSEPSAYPTILDLDKAIRAFPAPGNGYVLGRALDGDQRWSQHSAIALQQYSTVCLTESNLLHLHRSYFIQAIRECSSDPLQHAYGASVMAIFHSACRLTSGLRSLYSVHPRHCVQCWFFSSNVYFACLVLGTLVMESPASSLAEASLRELEMTVKLYGERPRPCLPPETVSALQKLAERASKEYATASRAAAAEGTLAQINSSRMERNRSAGHRGFSPATPDQEPAVRSQDNAPSIHPANGPAHNQDPQVAELVIGYSQRWGTSDRNFTRTPSTRDVAEEGDGDAYALVMGAKKRQGQPSPPEGLPFNSLQRYDLSGSLQALTSEVGGQHGPGQVPRTEPFQWHATQHTIRQSTIHPTKNAHSENSFPSTAVAMAPQPSNRGYAPGPDSTQEDVWKNMMGGFASV